MKTGARALLAATAFGGIFCGIGLLKDMTAPLLLGAGIVAGACTTAIAYAALDSMR